jgi:hypothetical protein
MRSFVLRPENYGGAATEAALLLGSLECFDFAA